MTPLRSINSSAVKLFVIYVSALLLASSQRTQTSSIYKLATFSEYVDFALKYSGFGDEHLILKDKQIHT